MRFVLTLLVLAGPAVALAADQPSSNAAPFPAPVEQPNAVEPHADGSVPVEPVLPSPLDCRDRIYQVREERGLPRLQRDSSNGEEALLIAAVDQRLDGCSVMVMKHDTSDIRPLPRPEGPPRLIPLR